MSEAAPQAAGTCRGPFAGMPDRAVVEYAAGRLRAAAALRPGSAPSRRQLRLFRLAMAELEERQMAVRRAAVPPGGQPR